MTTHLHLSTPCKKILRKDHSNAASHSTTGREKWLSTSADRNLAQIPFDSVPQREIPCYLTTRVRFYALAPGLLLLVHTSIHCCVKNVYRQYTLGNLGLHIPRKLGKISRAWSTSDTSLGMFDSQAGLATRGPFPPIALLLQHLDRVPSPETDLVRVLSFTSYHWHIVRCWVVERWRQLQIRPCKLSACVYVDDLVPVGSLPSNPTSLSNIDFIGILLMQYILHVRELRSE